MVAPRLYLVGEAITPNLISLILYYHSPMFFLRRVCFLLMPTITKSTKTIASLTLRKATRSRIVQLGPVEIDPLKSTTSELPLSAITPPESVKYAFEGGNETVGCVFSNLFCCPWM